MEFEHSLRDMLTVGKIRVPLVGFPSGDIPVTQKVVLAHRAAVSHGRYVKSFVGEESCQLP